MPHTTGITLALAALAALALGLGCSSKTEPPPAPLAAVPGLPGLPQGAAPAQPGQLAAPGQPANPMAAMMGALGAMGQAMGQGAPGAQPGAASGTAVAQIPWQSLSQALPVTAPGWQLDGQVTGQNVSMMGISVSEASAKLLQGQLRAEVKITDTMMNAMIAMPFNMMRATQVDSPEEHISPINLGTYPAMQVLDKRTGRAEVMAMVNNRILVDVRIEGAGALAPAVQLAATVNFAHLASLLGK